MRCAKDAHARCHKHAPIVKKLNGIKHTVKDMNMLNYGGVKTFTIAMIDKILIDLDVQPEELLKEKT